MVETARLGAQMSQQYFTCTVLKLPSGTFPKLITVRLPTIDSPSNEARWFGTPPLTVGDSVICRRDPNDQDILIIERSGDSPDTVFDILINNSGGTLATNDTVVVDTSQDNSVTTTTTLSDTNSPGIVIEGSENGDEVQVKRIGLVTVILDGVGARGDFIQTSTTAKKVNPTSTLRGGCFGQLLEAGILDDTKRAVLFGMQGMHNLVEDLIPQLGGDLDANTFNIQFDDTTGIHDDSDNELIIFKKTVSAITHFEVTNAATGNGPSIAAAGETNTDFLIDAKGAGDLILQNTSTGKVGIGTATPGLKLDIKKNNSETGTTGHLQIEQDGVGDAVISYLLTGTRQWLVGIDNDDADKFKIVDVTGGVVFTTRGLVIDTSGNVALGTATPTNLLHLFKNNTDAGAATEHLRIEQDGTGDAVIGFLLTGVNQWLAGIDNADLDKFKIVHITGGSVFTTVGIIIDTSGNVGVGVASPAELLEIESGASTTTLQISNNAPDGDPQIALALAGVKTFTIGVDDGDGDKFKIGTTAIGASTRLTIDSSGNVGIGTTTPTGTLTTGGDRVYSVQTLTDTGTMLNDKEAAILINAAAKTVTLPAHKVDKGIRLTNNGAGTWTLSPTSGNIKGSASIVLLTIEDIFLLSDGTDWI